MFSNKNSVISQSLWLIPLFSGQEKKKEKQYDQQDDT